MINLPLMDFPQVETEQAGLSILKQNGAINLLELNITSQMLIKIRCSSKKMDTELRPKKPPLSDFSATLVETFYKCFAFGVN